MITFITDITNLKDRSSVYASQWHVGGAENIHVEHENQEIMIGDFTTAVLLTDVSAIDDLSKAGRIESSKPLIFRSLDRKYNQDYTAFVDYMRFEPFPGSTDRDAFKDLNWDDLNLKLETPPMYCAVHEWQRGDDLMNLVNFLGHIIYAAENKDENKVHLFLNGKELPLGLMACKEIAKHLTDEELKGAKSEYITRGDWCKPGRASRLVLNPELVRRGLSE